MVPATTRLRAGAGGAGGVSVADGAAGASVLDRADEVEAGEVEAGEGEAGDVEAGGAALPAPAIPVTNDRKPGTSGRQHGDRNVTAPAAAAIGIASSNGPELTSCPMLTA
jgi:hypothetical protein